VLTSDGWRLLHMARRREVSEMLEKLPKANPREQEIADIAALRGTENLAQRS
jgi:hypothetical protein